MLVMRLLLLVQDRLDLLLQPTHSQEVLSWTNKNFDTVFPETTVVQELCSVLSCSIRKTTTLQLGASLFVIINFL